jgi:geranylgeranyl diphosphate synthase type I
MIFDYIKEKKQYVDIRLSDILAQESKILVPVGRFGDDALSRLQEFCTRGKGIRGMLVVLGGEMYGSKLDTPLTTIAAGMEIIHSSILIHDDIMDNDYLRRGKPSVFYQYEVNGKNEGLSDSHLYGQGMGLCVGIIGYFAAIQHVAGIDFDPDKKSKVLSFLSQEIEKVGVAQMQDCYLGFTLESEVPLQEIEQIYLYKTGRYTFSLPLILGGIYAGATSDELDKLELFGQTLGVVFQLKDDDISIYTDQEESGKTNGNDIRVNKKTYIRQLLFSLASPEERTYLEKQFGNPDLHLDAIKQIRTIIESTGTRKRIDAICDELSQKAVAIVDSLQTTDQYKALLRSLVEYNMTRTK